MLEASVITAELPLIYWAINLIEISFSQGNETYGYNNFLITYIRNACKYSGRASLCVLLLYINTLKCTENMSLCLTQQFKSLIKGFSQ